MNRIVIPVAVLMSILLGLAAAGQAVDDGGQVEPTWALGLAAHAGLGILGDRFGTFGVGSISILEDDMPSLEFSYQLSAIHLSNWETAIRLGGLAARMALKPEWAVNPVLGVRIHRLPYVSGFYIRARWTLGIETGAIVEVIPGAWARLSIVILMDQPLLNGYGYPGSGATGIELAFAYYVPIRRHAADDTEDAVMPGD